MIWPSMIAMRVNIKKQLAATFLCFVNYITISSGAATCKQLKSTVFLLYSSINSIIYLSIRCYYPWKEKERKRDYISQ